MNDMNNVIQFPVIKSVEINMDEFGRFNLNALHRASGGEKRNGPSYWLTIDSTQKLIDELTQQQTDTGISVSTVRTQKGGKSQGTFAVEQLAVAYANWISPSFYLQVINTFLAYRKGPNPSTLSRLEILRLAMEAEEENQRLTDQVEGMRPKVEFHDQVHDAPDTITVAEAAKLIGTGRTRLFSFLRKSGWISRRNEPYQSKIEAGLMDVKLSHWSHPDQGLKESVTAMITGKGLTRLKEIYKTERAA